MICQLVANVLVEVLIRNTTEVAYLIKGHSSRYEKTHVLYYLLLLLIICQAHQYIDILVLSTGYMWNNIKILNLFLSSSYTPDTIHTHNKPKLSSQNQQSPLYYNFCFMIMIFLVDIKY